MDLSGGWQNYDEHSAGKHDAEPVEGCVECFRHLRRLVEDAKKAQYGVVGTYKGIPIEIVGPFTSQAEAEDWTKSPGREGKVLRIWRPEQG